MSNNGIEEIQLNKILSDLKITADNVRTNSDGVKQQLKGCKNVWCEAYESASTYKQVRKLFTLAVHVALQDKVNLAEIENTGTENTGANSVEAESSKQVKKGLEQLLKITDRKSLNDYFKKPEMFKQAMSPLDMAKYLQKGVPDKIIQNLFQYQFDIRWNTDTGEPQDFTFYQFFDQTNIIDNAKPFRYYLSRLAHVKITLYKELRRSKLYLQGISDKKELCPIVYVKTSAETSAGWKAWQAVDENEFSPDIGNDFSWIDPHILQFIKENADVQSGDSESLKKSLKKPTLYWAVLNDGDVFLSDKLKLTETSRTQVYVGRAISGIPRRWTTDGGNHCEMMKRCLDNVCAMTTYDPLRLKGIQLVDARLALAKVRKEKTAVFVMRTFGDDIEKAKLSLDKAQYHLQNLIQTPLDESEPDLKDVLDEAKATLDEAQAALEAGKPDLEDVKNKLREAKVALRKALYVDSLKETVEKLTGELGKTNAHIENVPKEQKPDVYDKLLNDAEFRHCNGKIDDVTCDDIIPCEVLKSENNWKPKDMRYGMNYRSGHSRTIIRKKF